MSGRFKGELPMAEESADRRESIPNVKEGDKASDKWAGLERISHVLSLAAIPLVLAVFGWVIQGRLQDQAVRRDFVKLAVDILREPDKKSTPTELRGWAVDLLNDNSRTKLNPEAAKKLRSGEAVLPTSSADSAPRTYAKRTPSVDAGEVKLSSQNGEFLQYELKASGPIPIFSFECGKGVLFNASDFPGHPTTIYKWLHGKNRGEIDQLELCSLHLAFLTNSTYTVIVQRMDKSGKSLQMVKDVTYEGGPTNTIDDSLRIHLQ